jgi:hypothetical protein
MKIIFLNILISLFSLSCFSQSEIRTIKKVNPPEFGVYFGAFSCGATEDSVTLDKLNEIKEIAGFTPAWIYFSNNWFKNIIFPEKEVKAIWKFGSVPCIRLMPRSDFTANKPDPVYTLQKIIDGKFDSELKKWAVSAKETNIPIMIEFGTEVNGNWFPWSGAQNENDPKKFVNAYRHIIELFRKQSAYNITWVLHVGAYSAPNEDWNKMSEYYPGDDYIDWIGVSIYGAQSPNEEIVNFVESFDNVYNEMCSISENKPLAILEFGIVDNKVEGLKANWIQSVFSSIRDYRYPRIKALSYWNSKWVNDDGSVSNMRLDSSPDVLQKTQELLSDYFFRQKINFK